MENERNEKEKLLKKWSNTYSLSFLLLEPFGSLCFLSFLKDNKGENTIISFHYAFTISGKEGEGNREKIVNAKKRWRHALPLRHKA
jgi:hypothetical protein